MFNKIKKIYAFFRSTFIDQRKYIYLNLELDQFDNSFVRDNEGLNIYLADISDKEKIKADLYPYFDNQQNYFKQYLSFDDNDVLCYLASKETKIVHYFLVFKNAKNSPLNKTRFKTKIGNYDHAAYLGNAFTISSERGGWIVLQVLSVIINELKISYNIKNALVLVHPDTPGALKFYQRLGFKRVY
ncbi:hypothetical protein OAU43_06120 [Gammaproteobacteria bacterium]|nr:hypothetical protein [Gammaproteobacteria bacterium]